MAASPTPHTPPVTAWPQRPPAEAQDRGWLGRAWLALGLFALVLTGVHAGADVVDDRAFEAVLALDRGADALATALIEGLAGLLGLAPATSEVWLVRALELVDDEAARQLGRALALGVEVLVALVLALPLVDPRAPQASRVALARALRATFRDPTVLLWAAPLATAGASLAGLAVVATELEAGGRALLAPLGLEADLEVLLTRLLAVGVTSVVLVVLAVRSALRAWVRAEALAAGDARRGRIGLARRLRGSLAMLLAVPVVAVAVRASAPVLAALVGAP